MSKQPLTARQKTLLRSAVEQESPEFLELLVIDDPTELPMEKRTHLQTAIIRAQMASGYKTKDFEELNGYGRELNDILHLLGP